MMYSEGKLKLVRYFNPLMEPRKETDKPLEETISEVEAIVHETVDAHMIADVEVGSLLSSGVDSSYVVSEFPGNKTFTVGFLDKNSKYNEIGYAEGLTKELNKENYSKNISGDEYFDVIPKVMYYMDEPLADPACIALYFVDQLASSQLKVVLSGEGADEFFGGYNIYREPLTLRWVYWLPLSFRKKLAVMVKKLPKAVKGRGYLIRAALPIEERYIGNAYIFHEEEKARLLKRKAERHPKEVLGETYAAVRHLSDAEQMQSVDLKYWLPGDILQKADRMSMAHSLELRVPFLDWDVFRIAKGLPCRMKLCRHTTKYILRLKCYTKVVTGVANKI